MFLEGKIINWKLKKLLCSSPLLPPSSSYLLILKIPSLLPLYFILHYFDSSHLQIYLPSLPNHKKCIRIKYVYLLLQYSVIKFYQWIPWCRLKSIYMKNFKKLKIKSIPTSVFSNYPLSWQLSNQGFCFLASTVSEHQIRITNWY